MSSLLWCGVFLLSMLGEGDGGCTCEDVKNLYAKPYLAKDAKGSPPVRECIQMPGPGGRIFWRIEKNVSWISARDMCQRAADPTIGNGLSCIHNLKDETKVMHSDLAYVLDYTQKRYMTNVAEPVCMPGGDQGTDATYDPQETGMWIGLRLKDETINYIRKNKSAGEPYQCTTNDYEWRWKDQRGRHGTEYKSAHLEYTDWIRTEVAEPDCGRYSRPSDLGKEKGGLEMESCGMLKFSQRKEFQVGWSDEHCTRKTKALCVMWEATKGEEATDAFKAEWKIYGDKSPKDEL